MVAQWKLHGHKSIAPSFPARKNMSGSSHKAQAEKELLESYGQEQTSSVANSVAITLVVLLKACAKQKDLHKGCKLHTEITESGLLQYNVFIGSALVSMYAKCGALDKAQQVFDELPVRNDVSWNTLIAGYAQQGRGKDALDYFERMQSACISPNAFTYACILKACGSLRALEKGQDIHAQIVREHLIEKDIVVASALVDMYMKCSAVEKAQEVFDKLLVRDKILWTTLIAGYAQHGHGEEAISWFERMQLSGFIPDAITFACILKACSSLGDFDKGEKIHAQIVRQRVLERDIHVCTALVDMYAKCDALEKAKQVFDELATRSVVLWNALIAGHAQHEHAEDALECFQGMQLEGFCPTSVTFACVLKACGSLGASDKGQEVHAQIAKEQLPEEDTVVGNALIYMYGKCGLLEKAKEVFDELLARDKASWTALIAGYVQHAHGEEALDCFKQMQLGGFSPDAVTFSCILKACGNMGALSKGEEIHAQILREKFSENNVVSSALLDMYTKCGAFGKAQEVFGELHARSVVSWNSTMAAYAQHENYEETLHCFEQMQREGFSPDAVTFACMLKACGNAGAAYTGQKLHADIVRCGLSEKGLAGNALTAMYANCGMLVEVQNLFEKSPIKDRVLWSTLLLGHAQLGMEEIVFSLFNDMIEAGIEPNLLTLTTVLNTCSHRGLLDEGQMFFEVLSRRFHIIPTVEHHSCMVDLFCRACHLEKAAMVVKEMPVFPDLLTWHTLLGACQKWGYLKLGRWAFEHAVQLDATDAATYVCMSNIFAAAGRQEDVVNIEAASESGIVWKQPASSRCNEQNRSVKAFPAGDKRYIEREDNHTASGCVAHCEVLQEVDVHDTRRSPQGIIVEDMRDVLSKDKIFSAITRTRHEEDTDTFSKLCTFLENVNIYMGITCTQNFYTSFTQPLLLRGWREFLQEYLVVPKCKGFFPIFVSKEMLMAHTIRILIPKSNGVLSVLHYIQASFSCFGILIMLYAFKQV